MTEDLRWYIKTKTLFLQGILNRETLTLLWQQREKVMQVIEVIDVSALQRVDSAGLALLVHLHKIVKKNGGVDPIFTGITDKLYSLIKLYNLQKVILSSHHLT